MIRAFRKSFAFQFLWLMLMLQMINISVDAPDLHSDSIKEDLTINEMESIVEIVLENGMDIANACPEHDEDDDSSANSIGKYSINLICWEDFRILHSHFYFIDQQSPMFKEGVIVDGYLQRDTPPPKC